MGRQDLEEPLIVLVELCEPQLRQDDHTDDLVPRDHRDGDHRFEQVVVGSGDRDRELDLTSIRGQQGGLRERDVAGDPLAQLRHECGEGLGRVLGEQLAPERDREQGVAVGLEQVDPAVVVVDDRSELRRDRGCDLLDVAEHVERGRQVVQHVQLRDGTDVVSQSLRLCSRCLCHGSPRHLGDRDPCSHPERPRERCRQWSGGA